MEERKTIIKTFRIKRKTEENIQKQLNNMNENFNNSQIIINRSSKELKANMEIKSEH